MREFPPGVRIVYIEHHPVLVESLNGGKQYSTIMGFGKIRNPFEDGHPISDRPLIDCITETMEYLGKSVDDMIIFKTRSRDRIDGVTRDHIEIVSTRLGRLRKTLNALKKELIPTSIKPGLGNLAGSRVKRDLLYPTS